MLSNRVAMGAGLAPPRFLWVPFVDALMLPLDGRLEAATTPDRHSLYALETKLLRRYMNDLGVAKLPASLDEYVRTILVPTLERQRKNGAVAVKFEAAYLRALDFDDPTADVARSVYARFSSGGAPTHAEYKALQDYLFRTIAREAGRLGLAVHIHDTDIAGSFYSARGAIPFSSRARSTTRHSARRSSSSSTAAGGARYAHPCFAGEGKCVRGYLDDGDGCGAKL